MYTAIERKNNHKNPIQGLQLVSLHSNVDKNLYIISFKTYGSWKKYNIVYQEKTLKKVFAYRDIIDFSNFDYVLSETKFYDGLSSELNCEKSDVKKIVDFSLETARKLIENNKLRVDFILVNNVNILEG